MFSPPEGGEGGERGEGDWGGGVGGSGGLKRRSLKKKLAASKYYLPNKYISY